MKRRQLVALVGALAAAPRPAPGQQRKLPLVGFLHSAAAGQVGDLVAALQAGMKETGLVDGQTMAMEYRWADNDTERLPALAASLVERPVDIIAAAGGDRSAMAAKQATSRIPIVAVIGGDPVASGLVASLAHPGGNLTGVSFLTARLTSKRLQLLLELVPTVKRVALLVNPANPQRAGVIEDVERDARAMGVKVDVASAESDAQFEPVFADMKRLGAGAVVIQADPYFNNVRRQLIALTAKYALPAIHERHAFVSEGGLMSYGTSLPDVYRQVGVYCGKILKGADPSTLPVLQPTKFELAVNLKTARTLGLTVPTTVLARADEIIE